MMSLPQGPPLHLLRQYWGPNRLLLDVSRQSRWILKQHCNPDFEVYAKRIQHSAHLIKYLEAFMPNDGNKAQSTKVQTIFAMQPPKGSDNKTFPQHDTKLKWPLGKTEWLLATLTSMEEIGQTKVTKTKGTKEVSQLGNKVYQKSIQLCKDYLTSGLGLSGLLKSLWELHKCFQQLTWSSNYSG